ncbi:MAG: FHA domain-containing protein [Acidobacteriota bacterium]|jgi:hypothetical protein
MKLEVSHPEGTPHEVDLPGKAVIGRDPSCDIVLSDSRCSRRHAVIEETADGLVIRDAGSANGIYVNGRRLERSPLSPGDTVRLGDTVLEVLPDVGATVVVAPDELDLTGRPLTPRPPVGRHPSSSRARSQSARSTLRPARVAAPLPETRPPLTVTALSLLWTLSVPACVAGGLIVAVRSEADAVVGILAAGTGLVFGTLAGVMAVGLRARAAWARHLQIAAAGIGLLVCPFTFASVTVLIYMLRADVRATFEAPGRTTGAGDAEPTFALSLLGMLAVGLALTAGAVLLL